MCWNASVSMNTWFLVVLGVVMAYVNGLMTIWGCLFLFTYGSIQLVETFLWRNLRNMKWNRIWSIIGLMVIMLEPVASIMMLLGDRGKRKVLHWLLGGYVVFLCIAAYYVWSGGIRFHTSVANNGHLRWEWLSFPWWMVIIWTFFLVIPLWIIKYKIGFVYCLGGFVLSVIMYAKYETWGSMWCWFGALAAIYYIVMSFWMSGVCW